MTSLLRSISDRLTPSQSTTNLSGFHKAPNGQLFPKTDPAVDGEECLHDCESCSIHYPRKWKIDEEEKLYGFVNEWSTHLVVATGKTDWVRDVEDEKGSVMEAVGKSKAPSNGKMMLSASDMPIPDGSSADMTQVLLLPAFTLISNVTPASVPDLIQHCINPAPTNTTPLARSTLHPTPTNGTNGAHDDIIPNPFTIKPSPHAAVILLCSQATRDARCGQSAPLLRRELMRHLRPLGLCRDVHDERPGGVAIYFISHVGGHKFAANMMVYRRGEGAGGEDEAAQCIWLARVRPEDCENIVRYTVLQGKVVKPESQLRGGFDRSKGLTSW